MKRCFVFIVFLLIVQPVYAATVYVDVAATGCDNDGTVNTNYDPSTKACGSGAATVFGGAGSGGGFAFQAAQYLSAGDTLSFRVGTYYQDTRGLSATTVTYSAGAPHLWGTIIIEVDGVTITNYNGEAVDLRSGSADYTPGSPSLTTHPNNPVWLVSDNNSFSGDTGRNFQIYGCIIMSGSGNTVEHLDIRGGWDHQSIADAWSDVIRFESSTNAIVSDNLIHDNVSMSGTDSSNKALMMHETDINTIVQNNHFYNGVSIIAYCKYQPVTGTVHATYRYNFFDGVGNIRAANSSQGKNLAIYQNVFVEADGSEYDSTNTTQGRLVYNNTFYITTINTQLASTFSTASLQEWAVFNNIYYYNNASSGQVYTHEDVTSLGGGYYDYNDYYQAGAGGITFYYNSGSHNFTEWNSFLGSGAGTADSSITTDPGFNPDDAVLDGDDPTDFKRTAYTANGRGGSYSTVMGAYITGSETIGLLGGAAATPNSKITSIKFNGVEFK